MAEKITLNNTSDPIFIELDMVGEASQNYTVSLYKSEFMNQGREKRIDGKNLGNSGGDADVDFYKLFNARDKDWDKDKPVLIISSSYKCMANGVQPGKIALKIKISQGDISGDSTELYASSIGNDAVANIDDESFKTLVLYFSN